VGPAHGSLVAAGGGRITADIIETFIDLAGGRDSAFVIIPTAFDNTQGYSAENSFLVKAGCKDVTVLDTRDRAVADSEEFVAPLRRARGVWIHGGQKSRLVDAYLNTRTHAELAGVLNRGGVIGGSSSGATILGSFLVRGAPETNHIMMAPGYQQGFGFLRGVAIDQHLLARHRERDMLPVIEQHPELLGIGIDEGTAIVVHGDRFRVIGASKVAVYDTQTVGHAETPFFFVHPGEQFDLANHSVLITKPRQRLASSPE
jgi:cyanophycinase